MWGLLGGVVLALFLLCPMMASVRGERGEGPRHN